MASKTVSKICLSGSCARIAIKQGRCQKHYTRFRLSPDFIPVHNRGVGKTLEERFWSRVDKTPGLGPKGECWEWLGKTSEGYGTVQIKGYTTKTHRVSWMFTYGRYPEKMLMHSCDNRSCVNPAHLKQGTNAENVQDKVRKNRQARGAAVRKSSLTDEKVMEMRERHAAGGITLAQLAKEYGVNASSVGVIISRKFWRHLP